MYIRVVAIGRRCFGALMAVSGGAKLLEPGVATQFLQAAIGASKMWARISVYSACAFQVWVGINMFILPMHRRVRAMGLVLAVSLLLVEMTSLLRGSTVACGCFGSYGIPRLLTLLVLGVGLVSLGLSTSTATSRQSGRRAAAFIVVSGVFSVSVGGIAVADTVKTVFNESQLSSSDVITTLVAPRENECVLVVVGSGTCSECCEFLAEHRNELLSLGRIVFITRAEPSEESCLDKVRDWVETMEVDDDTWWHILASSPPTLYWKGAGEPPRRIEGLSDVVR